MSIFLLAVLFIIGLLLEGTIVSAPLVLVFLLCFLTACKGTKVFALAFFSGLLLDVMALHPVGATSIYIVCFLFLVLLYQRKYEIASYPFVIASSFLGSFGYLLLFGYAHVFGQAVISAFIGLLLFSLLRSKKTEVKYSM